MKARLKSIKFLFTVNKSLVACLIFPLMLSPSAHAKKIILNPVDGVSLQDIMGELRSYRVCMDEARKTAKKGKEGYNKAQSQQCRYSYQALAQLMDKHSLKLVDHLSWQRWRNQDSGVGFSTDNMGNSPSIEHILANPSALVSGVKNEE